MDRTLKALSLILCYPTAELQRAMPEIGGVLAAESRLTAAARRDLRPLVEALAGGELYDLHEVYVHGESRDRGAAMVSLVETYRAAGFDPISSDLPDHLPVLLEFLATRPAPEAREMLADAAHIFATLAKRLDRRESVYAAVFAGLRQLSGTVADAETVAAMLDQPEDDPTDLAALDAVWAESEVTFGPDPNAGCPQVRDLLAGMDIPATPAPASPVAAE